MRTTLTLDSDVAALLAKVQKMRNASMKDVINDALRQGLQQLSAPPAKRRLYSTPTASLGRCLVGNIDAVAEVLSMAEQDGFK